jgi:hypothetical protein
MGFGGVDWRRGVASNELVSLYTDPSELAGGEGEAS